MSELECEFCNKKFSSLSSLNYHKKTAKYCLSIQNIDSEKNDCNYCNKDYSSKHALLKHLSICKEYIKVQNQDKDDMLLKENNKLKEELELQKKEHESQIDLLKKENYELKRQNYYLEIKYNNYKEQLDKKIEDYNSLENRYERLATKGVEKPTISTTNNTSNVVNNLNTFPTQEYINNKIEDTFNDKYIHDGPKSLAQYVTENIITVNGELIYICSDYARKNFKYKDRDGNEITDPSAVKLISMIKDKLYDKTGYLYSWAEGELDCLKLQERRNRSENKTDNLLEKDLILVKNMMDKALDMQSVILDMDKNNKFSNELAKLAVPKK